MSDLHANLVSLAHPQYLQQVVSLDRGASRWRRVEAKPDLPDPFAFRSRDRWRPDGSASAVHGGWWVIDEPALSAAQAGATVGFGADSAAAIQAALQAAQALGREVDDAGRAYRVDQSVTIPPGVVWRNARIHVGRRGLNVVRISSGAKFVGFEITGTGATGPGPSGGERAIYPATDDLHDVEISGAIKDIMIGVHLQPLQNQAAAPRRCLIDVRLSNIVGRPGSSEGYGVLLSPAYDCSVRVVANKVQRHAVYLSAGASRNIVEAEVDGCFQDAVTIYSLATQPPCEDNQLRVTTANVREFKGQGRQHNPSCVSIYGKANRNFVVLRTRGAASPGALDGAPYAAALVKGSEDGLGPYPRNNRVQVFADGYFSGPYVVLSSDAVETLIEGCEISGSGTVGIVGFTDSRATVRSIGVAGRVRGGTFDGKGARRAAIAVATQAGVVMVDLATIVTGVDRPIADFTQKARMGL